MNLEKIDATGGIYAPSIRFNNGIFYMIVTNVNHGGNFFVFATGNGRISQSSAYFDWFEYNGK